MQHLQGIVETAGLDVRRPETQIRIDQVGAGLNDALQFLDRLITILQIEQRQRQVIPGFVGRFVQFQRLSVQFDRAAGILQLALGLTEQRQELGISWRRRQRRLQFLARSFRATEIEVEMGKIEPGGHEGGIERERLSKLRHRFSHELARPGGAVGDSEQKMRLRRAGVGSEDGLQFLYRLFGAACARKEAFPHAIEPLLNRRIPLRGSLGSLCPTRWR